MLGQCRRRWASIATALRWEAIALRIVCVFSIYTLRKHQFPNLCLGSYQSVSCTKFILLYISDQRHNLIVLRLRSIYMSGNLAQTILII